MIENTLIVKVFGGLVAVGATSGAGVYAYKNGFFSSNDIRTYLVEKVTSDAATVSSQSTAEQNFSCKLESDVHACELFDLGTNTKKYVELSKLNSQQLTKSNTFTESAKYYKLNIDVSKFSKWDEKVLPTINVVNSSAPEKTIVSLKLLLRTDKITDTTKTGVVLVKLKDNLSSAVSNVTTGGNFGCKLGSTSSEKLNCTLKTITGATEQADTVDFSKIAETTSIGQNKQNHYYVLIFNDFDKSKISLNKSSEILFVNGDTTSATFIFNTFVVGDLMETPSNNNVVLVTDLTGNS